MTFQLTAENLSYLEDMSRHYNLDINELLNQALKKYRRYMEERKIEAEKKDFLRQHAQLKQTYLGRFVAMHHGQVIDYDQDVVLLHQRIRRKYGREAILIRQVEEEPERPLIMRSPRLHWNKL